MKYANGGVLELTLHARKFHEKQYTLRETKAYGQKLEINNVIDLKR